MNTNTRKTFTKSKQALVEEFIKEIDYLVSGMVDCVRMGDDGFQDAVDSLAEQVKEKCKSTMIGLNPEPKTLPEEADIDQLDNDSPRMIFRRFLGLHMQKLPREVLYGNDHEVMIYLENIALERKSLSLIYGSNYYTFQQELTSKMEELLPILRKKHKQPEIFS